MQRTRKRIDINPIDPTEASEPQSELMSFIGGIEGKWQTKVDQLQKQLEAKQAQLDEFAKRLKQADEILKYFDPEFSLHKRSFKCDDDDTCRFICALAQQWEVEPDDIVTVTLKWTKDNDRFRWHMREDIMRGIAARKKGG